MSEYQSIVFPKNFTEEQKQEWGEYFKRHVQRKCELVVIYNPDCGCPIDQFFLLDRFPMSPTIFSQCPSCKKGCLMEISEPIVFHLPIQNQDIELDKLCDLVVGETRQRPYIEAYQMLARHLSAHPLTDA